MDSVRSGAVRRGQSGTDGSERGDDEPDDESNDDEPHDVANDEK